MLARSDEQLMDLYQHGNDAAFTEIHRRYEAPLGSYIRNLMRALAPSLMDDSRDILQDVLAWIHAYRGRFIAGTMLRPWLYTTATRLTRNHIKFECRQCRDKRRSRPLNEHFNLQEAEENCASDPRVIKRGQYGYQHSPLAAEVSPDPDHDEHAEAADAAAQRLAVLPETHKMVIRMIFFEGSTAQEAANRLGVPKTTVDWWRRESLALMREVEITTT